MMYIFCVINSKINILMINTEYGLGEKSTHIIVVFLHQSGDLTFCGIPFLSITTQEIR